MEKVTLKDVGNPKREISLITRGDIALRQRTTIDGMDFVVVFDNKQVQKATKSIKRALSVFNKTMSIHYKMKA